MAHKADAEEPGSQSSLQCQAMAPTSHGEDRDYCDRVVTVVDPGPEQPDDVEVLRAFVARFVASFPEGFGSPAASELFLRKALDSDTEMDVAQKVRLWDLMQNCRRHRS